MGKFNLLVSTVCLFLSYSTHPIFFFCPWILIHTLYKYIVSYVCMYGTAINHLISHCYTMHAHFGYLRPISTLDLGSELRACVFRFFTFLP